MSSAMPALSALPRSTHLRTKLRPGKRAGPAVSVSLLRLTGGAHQLVGLDQHAIVVRRRAQREADDHKGRAEQEANHHHPAMGRSVRIVKRWDHGCSPAATLTIRRWPRNAIPSLT